MNHHFQASVSPGQMHSPDCLARITAATLRSIVFEHLESTQEESVLSDATLDLSCAIQRAGFTEWKGQFGAALLSLGWDWVQLGDGQILHLRTVAPRANFLLLDAKGYDQVGDPPELIDVISRIPWQQEILSALAANPLQMGIHAH